MPKPTPTFDADLGFGYDVPAPPADASPAALLVAALDLLLLANDAPANEARSLRREAQVLRARALTTEGGSSHARPR